jgi:hypothetical protein
MGLLRRVLGKEGPEPTDAFGRPLEAEAPAAHQATTPSFEHAPAQAPSTTVWVNGLPLPPEQAQAVQSALDELRQGGGVDVTQTVDLSAVPGLRGELLQVTGLHSHDPAAMHRAALEVLRRRGLQIPLPAAGGDVSQPPGERTPAERLIQLDELRDRGVLTDAEFEEQRRRLLGDS